MIVLRAGNRGSPIVRKGSAGLSKPSLTVGLVLPSRLVAASEEALEHLR